MRKWLLWVGTVIVAAGVSSLVTAQVLPERFPQPRVLSGDNVGFRVEGRRQEARTDQVSGRTGVADILTGHLVVRVNGEWVEAEVSGGRVRPATN
ncbi:MAG: hypothetical protein AB7Q29_11985 [Vicinamibacterales bacterium]